MKRLKTMKDIEQAEYLKIVCKNKNRFTDTDAKWDTTIFKSKVDNANKKIVALSSFADFYKKKFVRFDRVKNFADFNTALFKKYRFFGLNEQEYFLLAGKKLALENL